METAHLLPSPGDPRPAESVPGTRRTSGAGEAPGHVPEPSPNRQSGPDRGRRPSRRLVRDRSTRRPRGSRTSTRCPRKDKRPSHLYRPRPTDGPGCDRRCSTTTSPLKISASPSRVCSLSPSAVDELADSYVKTATVGPSCPLDLGFLHMDDGVGKHEVVLHVVVVKMRVHDAVHLGRSDAARLAGPRGGARRCLPRSQSPPGQT